MLKKQNRKQNNYDIIITKVKKMKIKVSIIVPVYNVEQYLKKCLDSLVQQTLAEIEIIVVNDDSPDNAEKIIQAYVSDYPEKVKYFKKPNGGLGDARNFGVKYAQGEYLAFFDSDDYVELDTYELLYQKAKELDSDLVVNDLVYEYDDHQMIQKGLKKVSDSVVTNMFFSPLFAWNKLYRTSFYLNNNYQFPKKVWYEDIYVTVPMFSQAKNIGYVPKVLNHYLQRAGSIMASGYNPKLYDIFKAMDAIYQYYQEHNLLTKFHDEIEYLYIEHLLLYGAYRFLKTDHYHALMKEAQVKMTRFPNWKKNPYLKLLSQKERFFLTTNHRFSYGLYHLYLGRK